MSDSKGFQVPRNFDRKVTFESRARILAILYITFPPQINFLVISPRLAVFFEYCSIRVMDPSTHHHTIASKVRIVN